MGMRGISWKMDGCICNLHHQHHEQDQINLHEKEPYLKEAP